MGPPVDVSYHLQLTFLDVSTTVQVSNTRIRSNFDLTSVRVKVLHALASSLTISAFVTVATFPSCGDVGDEHEREFEHLVKQFAHAVPSMMFFPSPPENCPRGKHGRLRFPPLPSLFFGGLTYVV